MASSQANMLIHHLRAALAPRDAADLSDGQLLGRFVTQRDEASFAALVRRHGPMVWGVCRRVLCRLQDAEDAFQATFLVFVQKAATILPRSMVGSWLYGVAYRAALKARAVATRRRVKERQVAAMSQPLTVAEGVWNDLEPLLDQELNRLPDKYRLPLVLCDLDGKTRKEASAQLGWPEGTVAGRLARGRAMLAKRLRKLGLPLSSGLLAAVLSQNTASAAVPGALVSSTVRAATLVAAGKAAAAAGVPLNVAVVAKGVLNAMLMTKCKLASAAVLLAVIASAFVGVLTHHALAAWQDTTNPTATSALGLAQDKARGGDAGKPEVPAPITTTTRNPATPLPDDTTAQGAATDKRPSVPQVDEFRQDKPATSIPEITLSDPIVTPKEPTIAELFNNLQTIRAQQAALAKAEQAAIAAIKAKLQKQKDELVSLERKLTELGIETDRDWKTGELIGPKDRRDFEEKRDLPKGASPGGALKFPEKK